MTDLSADQRAILELLLIRELGYEEIGEVTGIGAAEARARAKAGFDSIGGRAGIDSEFPGADVQVIAELDSPEPSERKFPLGLIAGGLGAICIAFAALAFAGVFDGDPAESEPAVEEAADPGEPVAIALSALGDGGGEGTATIALDEEFEPVLGLSLSELAQPAEGEIYMLWVDNGLGRGLPLPTPLRVARNGSLDERFSVAPELIPILELGENLELIAVDSDALAGLSDDVVTAGKGAQGQPVSPDDLPERPGDVVLTGQIPDR